ncbi:conserved hypothetical protein [Mesorhizobium ventifaucium]|uniref:Uncharacterized protein n=1 Tax=Mesorhizobium ventifaucium TaxID=666020 RepID=A0ABM9DKA3_9HYPH|nr:conserved hypothetical protein [Mesorhizobium ventifaucium]
MCGEGGRSYLGRSAPCPEFRTRPAVRRADRGAEVSRGHSSSRVCLRRRPERWKWKVVPRVSIRPCGRNRFSGLPARPDGEARRNGKRRDRSQLGDARREIPALDTSQEALVAQFIEPPNTDPYVGGVGGEEPRGSPYPDLTRPAKIMPAWPLEPRRRRVRAPLTHK